MMDKTSSGEKRGDWDLKRSEISRGAFKKVIGEITLLTIGFTTEAGK
jgi:hypothetical protein